MKTETKALLFGGVVVLAVSGLLCLTGLRNLGLSSLAGGAIGGINLWLIAFTIRRLRPGTGQALLAVFMFLMKWVILAAGLLIALKLGLSAWGILIGLSVILTVLAVAGLNTKHVHSS